MDMPKVSSGAKAPSFLFLLKRLFSWLRERPIRRGLPLLLLLYLLNIARFALWPPVGWMAEENPTSTAFMEYRQELWEDAGKERKIQQSWVPLGKISPNLRRAVIIAEDSSFWEHSGFDLQGMRVALEQNWDKGRLAAGGSTITQQLAKNLYFSPAKSLTRKAQEAIVAYRLEQSLSKERILEIYLNVVEWGDGIYGAEAAARRYFKTSAANLSPKQAATLAAMLPAPLSRKPDSRHVQRVASTILRRMR